MKKSSPPAGFEPRSAAWQASALTVRLSYSNWIKIGREYCPTKYFKINFTILRHKFWSVLEGLAGWMAVLLTKVNNVRKGIENGGKIDQNSDRQTDKFDVRTLESFTCRFLFRFFGIKNVCVRFWSSKCCHLTSIYSNWLTFKSFPFNKTWSYGLNNFLYWPFSFASLYCVVLLQFELTLYFSS